MRTERRGPVCVLAVSGTLDIATSAWLAERIAAERAGRPARLVIDMSGVGVVDSSGARVLAAVVSPAPGQCPVVVRSLRPAVRRLLELIGADLSSPGPDHSPAGTGPHGRGREATLAGSPTGTLVRERRYLHGSAAQAIADSRRTAQLLASTEDQIAATMLRLAVSRPGASARLERLSQAARGRATQLREQAGHAAFPAAAVPARLAADRPESATGTVRRAVTFIEERARDDIAAADIAAAASVTVRAVQLAFRRYLGTTPMGYLRQVRIERAHQQLLTADPQRTTVTRVAADWGFASPSRFSLYYRAAYGFLPGQTLRRHENIGAP